MSECCAVRGSLLSTWQYGHKCYHVGTRDSDDGQSMTQCQASTLGRCNEQRLLHDPSLGQCFGRPLVQVSGRMHSCSNHDALPSSWVSLHYTTICHTNVILTVVREDYSPPLLTLPVLTFMSPLQTCPSMTMWECVSSQMLTVQIDNTNWKISTGGKLFLHFCRNGFVVSPYGLPSWYCGPLESVRQVLSVQVAIFMCPCKPQLATAWMITHTVCGIVLAPQLLKSKYCTSSH